MSIEYDYAIAWINDFGEAVSKTRKARVRSKKRGKKRPRLELEYRNWGDLCAVVENLDLLRKMADSPPPP